MTARGTGVIDSDVQCEDEGVSPARRVVDRVLLCGATATAVIFLAGLVVSFVGICFMRHPWVGFSDNTVLDAKALATGHLQYGNPATQYVGFVYTPVMTFLFAGLLKVYWWEGWGPVLSMVAALAAMAALLRMLWTTTRRWESRLVAGSFIVVLSLGGLSVLSFNGLFEARPDQLAWCLLVVAGTVVFRGLFSPTDASRRQMIVAGLLLTASVFTKQTTIVPCVVVGCLTIAMVILGERWRTWTRRQLVGSTTVLVTFVGSSAVFGIALQIASHGWAYDLLVHDSLRYARAVVLGRQVRSSLLELAVPLAVLVVLVVSVAWSLRARPHQDQRRRAVIAVAAVVVAVSSIPTAILAVAKLGGRDNQLIGPVWTLTLGCVVLLVLLGPSTRQFVAAAIACCALVAGVDPLSHVMADHRLGVPNLRQQSTWIPMDPFLYAAVDKGEAVYDEFSPSLSVSPRAPGYPASDWGDILAAGYTPRSFIENLLHGRYALVRLAVDSYVVVSPSYTSDLGRYDGSVPWKINLLIKMGYTPVTDPDSGVVYYRPGPRLKQLGWFADCFGPYQASGAGVDVRLRGDGGLVCIDGGGLDLSEAPSPTTQVVMTLDQGRGEASVRFGATPQTLRVRPLGSQDQRLSSGSDGTRSGSVVARCLAHDGRTTTLTLKAVVDGGGLRCHSSGSGPVLEVPVAAGQSVAHVSIDLAAADTPTIVATSKAGRAVPFTLLNLTPGDVNSL